MIAKIIQWRKELSFQHMVPGLSTYRRMKWKLNLTPYAKKITSKSTVDPNIGAKAVTLFRENIGINLHNLGLGNSFLTMTPKT